ncbi:hypothetical protein [Streptomyces sp. Da 82-17]|uniref:hypothetical protein n=1 Tax=Streptomyces sp. Da 82-17 TaxID=3377116 RepID=UPI0038D4E5EA
MTTTPAPDTKAAGPVLGAWQPLPTAGATPNTDQPNPLFDKLIYGRTASDWAIRAVLVVVMTAALATGTWSIYTLLTVQLHAPKEIAILGCGMFDVAALFFALLAQKYAVTTDSGLAPRLAMLAMISTSAWVNWQHGQLEGWGTVGSVILAAAPIIAELAFEMFHRYAHRETLRSLGRVAQTLPVLGKWAWLFHPRRSRKAIDAHIKAALKEHEAVAERREEVAVDRAHSIVSAPRPAITLERLPAELSAPDTNALAERAHEPALTEPAERPALTSKSALTEPAQKPTERQMRSERDIQQGTLTSDERAHKSSTSTERTPERAQNTTSFDERKVLHAQQDTLTLTLWKTLNERPEWTEIRDALTSAGLPEVSRATAQRIRERVQNAHPELPRERGRALSANS